MVYTLKKGRKKGAGGQKEEVPCRACNPENANHHSYAYKYNEVNEAEFEFPGIFCDDCGEFYHSGCVDLEPYMSKIIDRYQCPACIPPKGKYTIRKMLCPHRVKYDSTDPREMNGAPEVATKTWMDDVFPSINERVPNPPARIKGKFKCHVLKNGDEFNRLFKKDEEWTDLYLIRNQKGLGLKIPPKPFGIDQVIEKIGQAGWLVDVTDVYTQESAMMSLQTYKEKAEVKPDKRDRLYNVLSLEFSETAMRDLITPPSIYQELSLPEKFLGNEKGRALIKDNYIYHVERFCLLSMGGSYSDFHVDFGGSSVWYHVHTGKKVFFVVPPTQQNLELFEAHKIRDDKTVFLGDLFLKMGQCWRIEINEGETALMPGGWIHAVYTPVDSVVFGGNFLTHGGMRMQIEIGAYEVRTEIDESNRYPNFELVLWLAASDIVEELRATKTKYSKHRLDCAIALHEQLIQWRQRDVQEKKTPVVKNTKKVLEDLEKTLLKATGLKQLPKSEHLVDRAKMEELVVEQKKRVEEEKKRDIENASRPKMNKAGKRKPENSSPQVTTPKQAKRAQRSQLIRSSKNK